MAGSSKVYKHVCEDCGKEFYYKRLVVAEHYYCEQCRNALKAKTYRESHKEQYRAYSNQYRLDHKEYFKAYAREYRKVQRLAGF